jgi:signal transduction histidine kinase
MEKNVNEIFKGFVGSIILFVIWSAFCFWLGYILCDRQATKRINDINQQLAEQQQRYEELIRTSEQRIRNIKEELFGKISDNGTTVNELTKLVEQIRKQKFPI